MNDYIPKKDAEFNAWFEHLVMYVRRKVNSVPPDWTHIPDSEVTLLTNSYLSWNNAYTPTLGAHLPAQTLAKNEARDASEAVIRPFVGQWLVWKQVTNKEREEAGVHNAHERRDHIPAPATVPELSPVAGHPRQIVINYRDLGSHHRGKPADVHGIEIVWDIRNTPPSHVGELIRSSFDTASPHSITFDEQDRGKRVYMAGRWEIEREGIKGDFGEIVSAIIP